MSFMSRIENSPLLRRFFQAVDPNTPTILEVIKQNLSMFAEKSISQEECIKNCIKRIEDNLQPANWDLSAASQSELVFHISNFNIAVRRNSNLKPQANFLIRAFQMSFCEVVEKKWTDVMAHSFNPITSVFDKEMQMAAAQKWTQQYFVGVTWLNKWEECPESEVLVSRLHKMTELAFEAFSREMKIKDEVIQLPAEDDLYCNRPESVNFGEKILSPGGYVERDAISLTASERERSCQGSKDVEKNLHFQAGRSISSFETKSTDLDTYVLLKFESQPTIEEQNTKLKLMAECLSLGNKCKQHGQSIESPESSDSFHSLFASLLNKA